MTGTIAIAVDIITRLRDAQTLHAFERSLSEFTRLLGSVPDAAVSELSSQDLAVLRTLSEEVIERIEERAARGAVRSASQQSLISRLYEIRRLLEEIYTWRQHFSTARPVLIL
jgi:hypothetical protein